MIILDYDEFGIYTTIDDVKNYISQLFDKGIETESEIYEQCLNHFGNIYSELIDSALYE
jgi:hypothetical protein